ncbi:unnamed protein product [Calypogeia fissa]
MRQRWSIAKRWQKASLRSQFVTKFEDQCKLDPRPYLGSELLFIMFFKSIMPSLGFRVWDSLVDEHDWDALWTLVSQCSKNPNVFNWAVRALSLPHAVNYPHLNKYKSVYLTRTAIVFKSWWTP